jgi:hypothetical protein
MQNESNSGGKPKQLIIQIGLPSLFVRTGTGLKEVALDQNPNSDSLWSLDEPLVSHENSNDGKWLIGHTDANDVHVVDLETKTHFFSWNFSEGVNKVYFSPNSQFCVITHGLGSDMKSTVICMNSKDVSSLMTLGIVDQS